MLQWIRVTKDSLFVLLSFSTKKASLFLSLSIRLTSQPLRFLLKWSQPHTVIALSLDWFERRLDLCITSPPMSTFLVCWYVKEGYLTAVAHSLGSIFYLTPAIFLNPGVSQCARVNVFHFSVASSVCFISTSELSAWAIYICVHAFFLLQFVMLTHTVS